MNCVLINWHQALWITLGVLLIIIIGGIIVYRRARR